jgi:hypothetical protein
MVYATYISLFRAAFDFPAWTAQGLVMLGCAVLALYNIFFVVRGFIKIAKELTKRGE